MNIFILDSDPTIAAQSLADQHINKMIIEHCQLLATAHNRDLSPYKHTHFNHPCAKWVRESLANYVWLIQCTGALIDERHHRWPDRAIHKSESVWLWYAENVDLIIVNNTDLTPFAQAMPDIFKSDDAVKSYRAYYKAHKRVLNHKPASWTNRETPNWLSD